MDLDALVAAARPPVDGPTDDVVAGHRAALDGLAAGSDRRRWRRSALVSGRGAAALGLVAVFLLVIGIVAVGLSRSGPDRRTVVADTGSTTTTGRGVSSLPTTTTSPTTPTTTTTEPATGGGRPEADGALGGLEPAQAICGIALPEGVEILPGPVDAIEPLAPQMPGQLAQRVTRGSIVVEYRWPALAAAVYAGDDPMVPRWVESALPVYHDGSVRLFQGRDPAVATTREPVEGIPGLGPEPYAGAVADDGSDLWVIDWLSEELLREPEGRSGVGEDCGRIAIDVYDDGDLVNRFGWDLSTDPSVGFPVVPLDPLIVESRQDPNPPSEAVACDGGADFPNERGTGDGSSFPTPADALIGYLAVPRDTSFSSSFIEYVVSDGRHVYVDTVAGELIGALVVTVEADDDGSWSVVAWEHSGC